MNLCSIYHEFRMSVIMMLIATAHVRYQMISGDAQLPFSAFIIELVVLTSPDHHSPVVAPFAVITEIGI